MTDEHYYIRREEWAEVRDTVKRIEAAVIGFLEREKSISAATARAQETADKANERIDDIVTRLAVVEVETQKNSGNWSDIKGLTFKIISGLILAGLCGLVGYMVAT